MTADEITVCAHRPALRSSCDLLSAPSDPQNLSSPVRTARPRRRKRCRPMPAGSFMNVPAAAPTCGQSREIAACSVPMARCRVRRFRRSVRARPARLPAVRSKPPWQTIRSKPQTTGWVARAPMTGVVDSASRHCCGFVCSGPCSRRRLDHRPHLDGDGVPSECKTLRTHPLPLHGTLLSRHDRTGARACVGRCFRRFLWMALFGCVSFWPGARSFGGPPNAHGENSPDRVEAAQSPGAMAPPPTGLVTPLSWRYASDMSRILDLLLFQ